MKTILWLTSWFPNRIEPLAGDFIERHARAASLYNKIHVIFIARDSLKKTKGRVFVEKKQYNDNCQATILYYKINTGVKLFDSFISGFIYLYYYRRLIRNHITEHGKPDIVNVHISYKAGIAALYCKWLLKINYVVSEQWTIFCKESKSKFSDRSFFTRLIIRAIYKNASEVTAVSKYLADTLRSTFDIRQPVRIPNVVETKLFFPSEGKNPVYRFIHISLLNYQKSPEQIFMAVKELTKLTIEPFELVIYGPVKKGHIDYVQQLELGNIIKFMGEAEHDIIAKELRKSHSLILYSRFETFGCVIIEAYASGIPVVVSDISVMHEIVDEKTGVFAKIDDPAELARKMLWIMNNREQYNSNYIHQHAKENYNFEKVGKQFSELYNKVIN